MIHRIIIFAGSGVTSDRRSRRRYRRCSIIVAHDRPPIPETEALTAHPSLQADLAIVDAFNDDGKL
jgi:hypothetical protein